MKVVVLHGGACERELQHLRQWLEGQNCEVVIIDPHHQASPQASILTEAAAQSDVLVLLIDAHLPLADAQIAVLAAASKGKKVIGVNLAPSITIEALEKFGSASVPFDRIQFIDAVCGDRFAWVDDGGEPREDPEPDHHKCKKRPNKNAAA
jgi:hypothetical protein